MSDQRPANAATDKPTGLLDEAQLRVELDEEQIFAGGTWHERQLRPASYALRISGNGLAFQNPGETTSTVYKFEDPPRKDSFVLQPGGMALVTSMERFQLSKYLAANIGVKFTLASRGVLVHTGMPVHPGFGLSTNDSDANDIKGKPLRFLLANISEKPVPITPEIDDIASIQFFRLAQPAEHRESPGGDELEDLYLERGMPLGPLSFFSSTAALRDAPAELDRRMTVMERGSSNVIFFGVYLVAAALLGLVLTFAVNLTLVDGLAGRLATFLRNHHLQWAALIGAVLAVLLVLVLPFVAQHWVMPRLATADIRRDIDELKGEVAVLKDKVARTEPSADTQKPRSWLDRVRRR